MLKTVLLILSAIGPGEARVAFAPADDAEECEAKRDVVTQILSGAGQAPTHALCGETEYAFSPYVHGAPPEAAIHHYRVDISEDGSFALTPLQNDLGCDPQSAAADTSAQSWCAVSEQRVIEDG